jgi:uncharacterized protein YbbC (DUF1343 family)
MSGLCIAAMKIAEDQPSALIALDRPNSYIGRSVPRPNLARLTQGRGQYVMKSLAGFPACAGMSGR